MPVEIVFARQIVSGVLFRIVIGWYVAIVKITEAFMRLNASVTGNGSATNT